MAFIGRRYFGGEALDVPRNYGVYGDNEFKYWPKCAVCSEKQRTIVPVEEYGATSERARSMNCKYDLIVDVTCHGKKQSARIEIPTWWSEAYEKVAMARLWFFGPDSTPQDNEVRWLGSYRKG